jgi:hypothetical protein
VQKDKKTITEKSSEFMATNWWILWVAIFFNSAYSFYSVNDVALKYTKALEKIDKASKGVVMLDYSGRAIYNDKKMIDALNPGFKAAILNSIRFYSVKDWQTLSNKFSKSIKSVEDLEAGNQDFVEFKENYLASDGSADLDFLGYEKTLLYLVSTDNLPEKIVPTGARVNSYKVVDNTFEIYVTIDVYQSIYMVESDKTIDRTGVIEVKASGVFDPEAGTPINPLGIRFNSYKPTYLKKR